MPKRWLGRHSKIPAEAERLHRFFISVPVHLRRAVAILNPLRGFLEESRLPAEQYPAEAIEIRRVPAD